MVPGAPAITELMLGVKNASDESVYDRSYSIRNNKSQVTLVQSNHILPSNKVTKDGVSPYVPS